MCLLTQYYRMATGKIAWCACVAVMLALFCSTSSWAISVTDSELTAIKIAAEGGYYSKSVAAGRKSSNPVIRDLIAWLYITDDKSHTAIGDMMQFINVNSHWPYMTSIRQKIEQSIDTRGGISDATLRSWFEKYEPLTDDGKYHHILSMNRAKGGSLLRQYWREGAFNTDQQEKLLGKFKNILTSSDHIKRLDTLIWEENYDRASIAMKYVPRAYRLLGDARIKLAKQRSSVQGALAKVPPSLLNDKGLIYERARWRRRNDLDTGALEMLNTIGVDNLPYPEKWWLERHILARRAIENKNYALAYNLAIKHGHDQGVSFAQGEWIAGWLALNYLNKPKKAFSHFKKLFEGTTTPISKSRGSYWSAVAAEKSGYADIATQWYKVAAQYYETYYGQMAGERLTKSDEIIKGFLNKTFQYSLTSNISSNFENNELVQAVRLLYRAGVPHKEIRPFMIRLRNTIDDDSGSYLLYAKLAKEINDYEALHLIGKLSFTKHRWNFWEAAFPLLPVRLTSKTSKPLAYSIMRQESAFNMTANSSAGAKGLMQLMPTTAKMVARKERVRYVRAHLTSKPNYNVRLGQSYLGGLVDNFDGALPMAIAGYNAGPNRVKQWNKIFGDPRKNEISWVNWIESIPISETRNYVQRVLENMKIYQYRVK